jgi:hypothetical protein
MDAKPAALTGPQRRDLERLFVRSRAGQLSLWPHVTTISMVTSLRRLHALQQMGLLMFSEIPGFYERFGVLGWDCRLTARARTALELELAQRAS